MVDVGETGEQVLTELDNVALAKRANEILVSMGHSTDHTIISTRWLNNGGSFLSLRVRAQCSGSSRCNTEYSS